MKKKGLLKFICFPSSHLVKMPTFFITVSKSYIWHTYLNDYSHEREEKKKLMGNDWHVPRYRGTPARKQVIVISKCYQHQCHSEMYLLFVKKPGWNCGKVSWISSITLWCGRNLAVPVRRLNCFHEEIKKSSPNCWLSPCT